MGITHNHQRMLGVYLDSPKEAATFLQNNGYNLTQEEKKFYNLFDGFEVDSYFDAKFIYPKFRIINMGEGYFFAGFLIGLEKINSDEVKMVFNDFKKIFPNSTPVIDDVEYSS